MLEVAKEVFLTEAIDETEEREDDQDLRDQQRDRAMVIDRALVAKREEVPDSLLTGDRVRDLQEYLTHLKKMRVEEAMLLRGKILVLQAL